VKKEFAVGLTEIIVTPESTGLVYAASCPEDLMLVDEQEALIRANHSPHAVTPGIEEDGQTLRWDAEWSHDQAKILGEGLSLPPTLAQAFDFQPVARFSLGRYGRIDMVGIEVDREVITGHLVSKVYTELAQRRISHILGDRLRMSDLTVGPSPFADNQLLWEATWGRGAGGASILHKFFDTNYDRRSSTLRASRN